MLSVCCSHGVPADHQMYSMLISKAGKAKDVDSALGLHQQMLDSHLQPTQVARHAALFVCWHGIVCWCLGRLPPPVPQPLPVCTITVLCQAAAFSHWSCSGSNQAASWLVF